MSTIAAGTTSTTALVSTGDTTGSLVFQTNGTTTAMTINTSQNVGIGTSAPLFGLSMAQGSGDAARIGWNDSGGSKRASIICSSSSDALQFHVGSSDTERMRLTDDGYLRMASGTGGIQFGGDTAAANALDDYEEGTWTPSGWNGGGSGLSYIGAYNKIGRQVTVYFIINGTGITSTAASSLLSGLPFVPSSNPAPGYFQGVCMNAQTTSGGVIQAYSDSKIYWAVSIASTTTLSGSVTYFV